ncbi:MAG: hypothetical protein KGZ82_06345, partial [Bacteroidales bacterium]|nr:hypothetical protein [Bacteroidales bacterium]
ITLNRNVKKNYLLNKLDFSINSNFSKGVLYQQNKGVYQRLDHPLGFLSNDLRSIHTLGKKLIEFSSFISVENNPNYLMIKPGVFEDILNNGAVYENARQSLIKKTLFTEHGTAMVFGHKNLAITPGIGVVYEQQTLGSNIETNESGQVHTLDDRFMNDQFQYNVRVYAKTELELLKSGFTLNIKMPISWVFNRLIDDAQDTNQTIKKCVFEPAISLNYKLKGFWKIGGSWVLTNRPDNTGFHHFGYVLLNYRSLSQNPTPFAFNKRQKFMATLSYRNTLSSFFNVFNYWYSISDYQLIYKYQVSSDGSTVLKALSIPNRATSFGFYLQSSKYLSGTRSTLGFKISFSQQQGFSYLNEALFNTRNQIILIEPYLSTRLVNWLHIEYQLTANYLKTFVVSEKLSDIAQFRHQISLFTLFEKKHLFNISTEFYRINGASLIFSDFKYRFSITRPKIDIETVWNNILNTAEFVTYQSDYTTVLETTYLLRPSQVSLTVRFNF